jgi:hypothetical protein
MTTVVGGVSGVQAALKKHHEVNGSDFASCPSVNYVGLLDPFKVQIQVSWTYSFGRKWASDSSSACPLLLLGISICCVAEHVSCHCMLGC